MNDLLEKTCKPSEGGAVKGDELRKLFGQLQLAGRCPTSTTWRRSTASRTSARRSTSSTAWARSPRSEGHHPDIFLTWGKVKVTLWTHSVGGLSENDFILAAKADQAG